MQAFSVSRITLPYTADMAMGRPAKTRRSAFGERLHHARLEAGLSQKQIAEQLGITQQSYAGWERRSTALKPDHLTSLGRILGVAVEHLLGQDARRGSKGGPVGKARLVFEEVSRLPRHKQQHILRVVQDLLVANGR